MNKLARAITKWTRACDKRLARLISYIHHTCEVRQFCHMGNTAQHCRLGLFQDSDFAGDLEDSKSGSAGPLCIFGSQTFVPICWMCQKHQFHKVLQKLKSFLSMQVYAWMEFQLLIFGIWFFEVFHFHQTNSTTPKIKYEETRRVTRDQTSTPKIKPTQHDNCDLSIADYVSSNAKSSQVGAMLFIFEDNAAVIKMIIKG